MEEKTRSGGRARVAVRITLVFFTVLLLFLFAAYGVMWILVNGPSPTAKRLFVLSVKETSAGGFLADLYLSDEEIRAIQEADSHEQETVEMDLSLISLPAQHSEPTDPSDAVQPSTVSSDPSSPTDPDPAADTLPGAPETTPPTDERPLADDGIEIIDVTGSTYHGKLMIVSDPTRVFVGVPDAYGSDASGLTVAAMIRKYGCTAGTNAGGFYDPNGRGTGGIPEGIVISEGKLLWGELTSSYNLAGIDGNGILHVGYMTAQHALDIGVRYAASYGPALVVNGKSAGGSYALGGGLNPRTAIGQRADGAMMLLVINGRALDSLGATLDDLVDIFLEYGAVNATNLDGGSSSIMIMNDEYLTSSAYIFGERVVATAILVK